MPWRDSDLRWDGVEAGWGCGADEENAGYAIKRS